MWVFIYVFYLWMDIHMGKWTWSRDLIDQEGEGTQQSVDAVLCAVFCTDKFAKLKVTGVGTKGYASYANNKIFL